MALFLCHTGNSPYSNVFIQCFYKNVFLRFSVFSRKCHKFLKNQLKTQFNLEALEKWKNSTTVPFSASSNDVEFHRAMLEKNNASVTMSGLSYQNFFNSKKYVALCLEDIDVSILHVAVYRKDADETIQDIVRMIRKEMHMK